MALATETQEQTVVEVFTHHQGSFRVVARFYGYGRSKKVRKEQAEKLAAIFLDAAKQRKSVQWKVGQRLEAAAVALHKGAVRWNELRPPQPGYRLAGLIALLTDGLLCPNHYLQVDDLGRTTQVPRRVK
jgi:hypothetical protein